MKEYCEVKLFIIFTILLFTTTPWAEDYDPLQTKVDDYLNQAFELCNTSEFEKAICLYKKALDLKPDLANGWYWLGRSYYRAGQMDQFFSAWDRFVRLSKEDTTEIKRKMKMYLNLPVISDTYEHLDTIKGNSETPFYHPAGLVIDGEDNVYISSFGSHAILKFSPIGNLLAQFGSYGKEKGKLNQPYGLALDREGNLYVVDSGNYRVQKFDLEGKFIMAFGKKGKKSGEFINPRGITLDEEGNIYVVDNGNSRIQIFSKEGKFIGQIGQMGKGKDKLLNPIGVALDEKEGVWIIEEEGKYLKNFTVRGSFKKSFTFPQQRLLPRGITYIPDGKLYIAFWQGIILKFDIEEEKWEVINITPKLFNPSALATNKSGLLYVANFDNDSISILMPEEFQKTQFDVLVHRIDTHHYPIIVLPITVTMRDKISVLKLTANNFKIDENGRWMRPITITTPVFDNEYAVITFIIDTSKKMGRYRDDVEKLLNKFINEIKGGIQAISMIGFCKKAKQIKEITRNKTALRDEVTQLTFDETKDKEAIFSAIKLGVSKMTNLICKKAICVIMSGDEVEEGTLFRECSYYAKNNHIPIFVVDYRLQGETNSMKKLAKLSLGDYFLAYQSPEAQKLYQSITRQIKTQNIYFLSYQTPQEEWAQRWVDVTVSAGYKHLYAKDKIGYLVPEGKGMDKEIVEKIANRIKKRRLEELAKKLEEEKKQKEAHKKAPAHGGGGGEKGKPEGFPPPKTWEEEIQPDIGKSVREEFVSEEAAAKKAARAAHGGEH